MNWRPWKRNVNDPDDLGDEIRIGLHALAKRALLNGAADTGLSIVLYGCSDRTGAAWGDWEVTMRRVGLPAQETEAK